jgi:hypothetical protein
VWTRRAIVRPLPLSVMARWAIAVRIPRHAVREAQADLLVPGQRRGQHRLSDPTLAVQT